jgi:hypothetical protein
MSFTPVTIHKGGNPKPDPVRISKSGQSDNGVTGIYFAVAGGNSRSYNVSGLSSFMQTEAGGPVSDPLLVEPGTNSANLVPMPAAAAGQTYTYTVTAPDKDGAPFETGDAQIQVDP